MLSSVVLLLSMLLVACDGFSITNIEETNLPTNIPTTTEVITQLPTNPITTDLTNDLESELKLIYQLALESNAFTGTYEEWLESVRGPQGLPGQDGRSVILRSEGLIIQWQHEGDTTWNNLFDLSILQGVDGVTPTISISEDGFWVINGEKTTFVASVIDKEDMVEIIFNTNGGSLPENYSQSMDVLVNTTMILPIPQKDGYRFLGWFAGDTVNDTQFYNQIPIVNDLTLYARWEVDPNYHNDDLLNHFFIRTIDQTSDKLTVEIVLSGQVKLCGFDIKLYYSEDTITYLNHKNGLSSLVSNASYSDYIHFNYVVSSSNISEETIITTIEFDIIDQGLVTIDFELVQLIVLDDNGLDIIETDGNSSDYYKIIE